MTDNLPENYRALVIEEQNGSFVRSIQQRSLAQLSVGLGSDELLIRVEYSSLNYKDALCASGNRGVSKHYPRVPGVDAVGTVAKSTNPRFRQGDQVIVTSYQLGMSVDGGFAEYIRVPAAWALPLPAGLTPKESMILGSAGFTAGMCALRLSNHLKPQDGPIAVSGASGGVGSLSVALLAKLGYSVTAISTNETDFLTELGADKVIPSGTLAQENPKPLLSTEFAGAIDNVGGHILANIIKSTQPLGLVTCCGNAASAELPLTVYPFILRGVMLMGIDSQDCPMDERIEVWNKLAGEWKLDQLMELYEEVTLDQLGEKIDQILKGKVRGRTIVRLG